ncbi:MAG: DUF2155 domain-containing protein [Zetaproteobacteria bacterium]|nr:MAG: DUF2155 domain-containing protein [Zetaproteobacteria bacterium]
MLALFGCDEQPERKIKWHEPLATGNDPHATIHADLPDWASKRKGFADLVWLDKSTARTYRYHVPTGEAVKMQGFVVRVLGLASGLRNTSSGTFLDDENVDNPAAFVEISQQGKLRYRGWLYVKFPELFGMDDPLWKVWLEGIKLRPARQGG